MIVLLLPMTVCFAILGCVTGFVVGRNTWGKAGGVLLGMALGMAPLAILAAAIMGLIWYSDLQR